MRKTFSTACTLLVLTLFMGSSPAGAQSDTTASVDSMTTVGGSSELIDTPVEVTPQPLVANGLETRTDQGECPQPMEGQTISCITSNPKDKGKSVSDLLSKRTKAKDAANPGEPEIMPFAIQPVPSFCQQATNRYVANRTDSCGVFSNILTVTETTNGVARVTGTMEFLEVSYTYTSARSGTWAHQ